MSGLNTSNSGSISTNDSSDEPQDFHEQRPAEPKQNKKSYTEFIAHVVTFSCCFPPDHGSGFELVC